MPTLVRAFDRNARRHVTTRGLVVAGADGWAVDTFGEGLRQERHGDRVVRFRLSPDREAGDPS